MFTRILLCKKGDVGHGFRQMVFTVDVEGHEFEMEIRFMGWVWSALS